MFNNLNFTSIFLMILGLLLFLYGAWSVYRFRSYIWGGGLMALGLGNGLFGWTNGFTDLTPTGRILTKFGILSLALGILVVGYTFYRTM